jgi:transmembrane sensor
LRLYLYMPLQKHQIRDIIQHFVEGKLTEAEVDVFFGAMNEEEVQELLSKNIDTQSGNNYAVLLSNEKRELLLEKIKKQRFEYEGASGTAKENKTIPAVHRVHFLKTAWFRYAAAIILLVSGIAVYYFINNETIIEKPKPVIARTEEILPGSDKAILTLSNGEKIKLNSSASETITDGSLVIKNNSGQLIYDSERGSFSPFEKGGSGDEHNATLRGGFTNYNTMSTPRGGQYKLTLFDGTKVWLNAESSITYPIVFNEKTREVSITGEAYLEVAQNSKNPFNVKLNDGGIINVLGTSFNINSYSNENIIKATLISGSIKVSKNNIAKILKPSQQALINEKINIDTNIDPEKVIAWKNGVFNFNDAGLPEVMRQLERWYDIKVEYAGKTNQQFRFRGELQRNLTLSQVLKVLERMEVKFRLEGKKLIVNP